MAPVNLSRHAVFHFLYDDRKQDSATTDSHSKLIIDLLQKRNICFAYIGAICNNNDGCDDKYRCATALYLVYIFAHTYNIIIGRSVVAPGYGREVVDIFNATEKRFLLMLMTTMQPSC